jgi:glycosyltransferase involved in cell wall biosynthesis
MKIACVSYYDSNVNLGFGKYTYYMLEALKKQVDTITNLSPLRRARTYPNIASKIIYYRKLLKRGYSPQRDTFIVKDQARQISKKLSATDADILLSPISPGSQPIAYVDAKQPIVIWTDDTFAGVIDFYPEFSSDYLCQETLRDGINNERAALNRCDLAIYWSDWAAKTALDRYNLDPAKVKVIPAGANIQNGMRFEEIKDAIDHRSLSECRLVWIGVDWYRKGGDVAFQVAKKLNESGLKTTLSIVGCEPEMDAPLPEFVKPLGFIDKDSPEGYAQLKQLLLASHFLVMPCRAEAYGLVFCEASAFGLPSISSNVGGIPTAVRNGYNGQAFPLDTPVESYCDYILELFATPQNYRDLALSSFNEYKTRLNWTVATQKAKEFMAEIR